LLLLMTKIGKRKMFKPFPADRDEQDMA
jgi:hypothetical protein